MVKIPRRGVRALPRAFNAHNTCVVDDCENRAVARVRFPGNVLLDLCKRCLPLCQKEAEIVKSIK